jgi:hypothetical protein
MAHRPRSTVRPFLASRARAQLFASIAGTSHDPLGEARSCPTSVERPALGGRSPAAVGVTVVPHQGVGLSGTDSGAPASCSRTRATLVAARLFAQTPSGLGTPRCSGGVSVAVGTGGGVLAERWDGRRWRPQAAPSPSGGPGLVGVSCASSRSCVAVGDDPGGRRAVLERWNGTKWQSQVAPPTTLTAYLNGVSCVTADYCIAVGGLFNGTDRERSTPLVEQWAAQPGGSRRWRRPRAPVSCTSVGTCTAVGFTDRANPRPLVERLAP